MRYRTVSLCTSLVPSQSGPAEAEHGCTTDSGSVDFKFDIATTSFFAPCLFRRTDAEPPLRFISINIHSRDAEEGGTSRKTPRLMAADPSNSLFAYQMGTLAAMSSAIPARSQRLLKRCGFKIPYLKTAGALTEFDLRIAFRTRGGLVGASITT